MSLSSAAVTQAQPARVDALKDERYLQLVLFGLAASYSDRKQQPWTFKTALKILIAATIIFGIGKRALGGGSRRSIKKVAIVGGGIAGAGAAWSLRKAGIDATIFEKKPKLGGNAKSYNWKVGDKTVETGLAVLAYPHEYFHSYMALMKELGIEHGELHKLEYFVAEKNFRGPGKVPDDKLECVFAYSEDFVPSEWLKKDLIQWKKLAAFVCRVNAFFAPTTYKSLYRMSVSNPLNLVSLRRLTKIYGISDYFWERVFVPVHTSTFLEVDMDTIPAVLAEVLNDMVPFDKIPEMRAWPTTAYEVFDRMQKQWPKDAVRTSCGVEKVDFVPGRDGSLDCLVWHEDLIETDAPEVFDAVVFACSAPSMEKCLKDSRSKLSMLSKNYWLAALEGWLLRHTLYTVDRDKTFEQGVVHSDPSVFPDKFRNELLTKSCNFMVVDGNNPRNIENHFIISSWAPTANKPDVKGKRPMLVSYNCAEKTDKIEAEWTVTSRDAHPSLTMLQLATTITAWPVLQGFRNGQCYYCGSAVVPANGHDLSMLSGFVAASELGAPYPLQSDLGNQDFLRLRRMMLGPWA